MDIKDKIQDLAKEAVSKLKADPALLASFRQNPVKAIEKIIGRDLPDEQIENIIALIKAKLTADNISEKAEDVKNAVGNISNLFKK